MVKTTGVISMFCVEDGTDGRDGADGRSAAAYEIVTDPDDGFAQDLGVIGVRLRRNVGGAYAESDIDEGGTGFFATEGMTMTVSTNARLTTGSVTLVTDADSRIELPAHGREETVFPVGKTVTLRLKDRTGATVAEKELVCVGRDCAWTADFDDEMMSVACDSEGHPYRADGTPRTDYRLNTIWRPTAHLYYGGTEALVAENAPYSIGYKLDGMTTDDDESWADGGRGVYFAIDGFSGNVKDTARLTVTFYAEDETGTERALASCTATLNRVRSGQDGQAAKMCQIVLSASRLHKDKTGAVSPEKVGVGVLMNDGTSAARVKHKDWLSTQGATDGVKVTASTTASPAGMIVHAANGYAANGEEELLLPVDGGTGTLTVRLYWKGVLVDVETVPTVADGEDGTGTQINGSFGKDDVLDYHGTVTAPTEEQIREYLVNTYTGAAAGDAYIYGENGHLWVYDGTIFRDVGTIRGPQGNSGTSAYLYIAWGKGGSGVGVPEGITDIAYTDKPGGSGYTWMGICISQSSTRPQEAGSYTWQYVKGAAGDTGRGIESETAYYMGTENSQPPTAGTGAWEAVAAGGTVPQPTAEKPYLWRYVVTTWTSGSPATTTGPVTLAATWQPGGDNPNLLRQTAFASAEAMGAWTRSSYTLTTAFEELDEEATPGGKAKAAYLMEGSVARKAYQGHNAWEDYIDLGEGYASIKVYLRQTVTGLTTGRWYTLSMWMKRPAHHDMTVAVVGAEASRYVDGAAVSDGGNDGTWSRWTQGTAAGWTRHTVTFKAARQTVTIAVQDTPPAGSGKTAGTTEYGRVSIAMPKLEEGLVATGYTVSDQDPAPQTRILMEKNAPRWKAGMTIYEGAAGEPYKDLYIDTETKAFYACCATHEAAAGNHPTQGGEAARQAVWEQGEFFNLMAIMTAYIADLTVGRLQTAATAGGAYALMDGSQLAFYGTSNVANIRIGIDDQGLAALEFYDNGGNLRRVVSALTNVYYDNDGTSAIDVSASWSTLSLLALNGNTQVDMMSTKLMYTAYQYHAGYSIDKGVKTFDNTGSLNEKLFKEAFVPKDGYKDSFPTGWYRDLNSDAPYKSLWVEEPLSSEREGDTVREVQRTVMRFYAVRVATETATGNGFSYIAKREPVYYYVEDGATVMCDEYGMAMVGYIEDVLDI